MRNFNPVQNQKACVVANQAKISLANIRRPADPPITQEIRGKANSQAADIYAAAYNKDPEFYRFTRTMESFTKVLDDNTTLVMSTDGDLLKYMNGIK